MPALQANETRAGYPVEIVNDVLGTRKQTWSPLSRGQVIENMMWACGRSTAANCPGEPFDVCVYVFPERIVVRLHCPPWKDLEAAKAAMQAFADEGRASP